VKAKANQDHKSSLDREFFRSFLEVIVYFTKNKITYLVYKCYAYCTNQVDVYYDINIFL
jgi:hypothetical protein